MRSTSRRRRQARGGGSAAHGLRATPSAARQSHSPSFKGWDAAYHLRITAEPRRYGFHATLKAPFRLAAGCTAHDVYRQASNLAASLSPVPLPYLALCELDGFVALGFVSSAIGADAVHGIAAQCVSCFDNLRAPATADEIKRRQAVPLSAREAHLLAQWGYPHVFDAFRFHLTLTGRLPANERAQVIEKLSPPVDALNKSPLWLDALTVYQQAQPDAPLLAMRRFHFDGNVDVYRDA